MMKMNVFMFTVVLTVVSTGLQAQKNTLLVYGNAGYSSSNATMYSNAYSFRPGVGYQWTDHLTAGVNLGFWGSKSQIGTDLYSRVHNFEAGPFLRWTRALGGPFVVYGQCDVNYQHSKNSNDASSLSVVQNGFVSRVWPAFGVNLHNGLALNFKFGEVSYTYGKVSGGASSSAFLADFNWTTGFQFGISKNFGPGRH